IPLRRSIYLVGTYADHAFTPEAPRSLDDGDHFYAPQTMRDAQGRRLMWGWLWEGRSAEASRAAGWAGVMSLPRVLGLAPDGALTMSPVPELAALRGQHHGAKDLALAPDGPNVLADLRGDSLELILEIEPGDAAEVELIVRRSPDGGEQTRLFYERATDR